MTTRASARAIGLSYARANLLFGPGGEVMALFRLDAVAYPLLSNADKWATLGRVERLAHVVQNDFSLWRVYRRAGDVGGRLPESYLGVNLRDAPSGFGRALLARADRARAVLAGLGDRRRGPALGAELLHEMAEAEQQLHERLASIVGLRRAHTRELEWLLRRAPLRGVAEPRTEAVWKPDALVIEDPTGEAVYEPLGWDLWRLPAAVLHESPDHPPSLHVASDEHDGYQALLCLGALAEEPVFPGPAAELLHAPLDGLPFPVDAVVHARWLGNREALGQVNRRIVDAEQTYRDQLQSAHGPAWRADDDRTLAREYEQVLQSGARPPMLYASISLAIGAGDREELERRVEHTRQAFGEVELFRPRGIQDALWLDHLPRVDGGRVPDYVGQVTAEQFGAMVPVATTLVGDERGVRIGHTTGGLRAPVVYDVTAAPRWNLPAAVGMAGPTGSGKTFLAQSIALQALLDGSVVHDFDPKHDHGWENVPELGDRLEVLTLGGPDTQPGALDPLVVAPDELCEDLALSYLLELLPDPPASWEHALARSVRDVAAAPHPSTRGVLDRLRRLDGTAGAEVADALDVIAEVGLGRLGFGPPRHEPVDATIPGLTTLRVAGLTLPVEGIPRSSYSRTERISVATLSLVTAKTLRLVSLDKATHKVVIIDEAWFLFSTPVGRALLNRLLRYARAYNATIVLITQLLEDLEILSDLVRVWWMYGHDSDEQVRLQLRIAGVEATDARVQRLRAWATGRALMRDHHGRVAEVQIDPLSEDLLRQFNTTPGPMEMVA